MSPRTESAVRLESRRDEEDYQSYADNRNLCSGCSGVDKVTSTGILLPVALVPTPLV